MTSTRYIPFEVTRLRETFNTWLAFPPTVAVIVPEHLNHEAVAADLRDKFIKVITLEDFAEVRKAMWFAPEQRKIELLWYANVAAYSGASIVVLRHEFAQFWYKLREAGMIIVHWMSSLNYPYDHIISSHYDLDDILELDIGEQDSGYLLSLFARNDDKPVIFIRSSDTGLLFHPGARYVLLDDISAYTDSQLVAIFCPADQITAFDSRVTYRPERMDAYISDTDAELALEHGEPGWYYVLKKSSVNIDNDLEVYELTDGYLVRINDSLVKPVRRFHHHDMIKHRLLTLDTIGGRKIYGNGDIPNALSDHRWVKNSKVWILDYSKVSSEMYTFLLQQTFIHQKLCYSTNV